MANCQEAWVKTNKYTTKQIKICSKKANRNNIKNSLEKLSRWRIASWVISNNETKN